MNGLDTMTVAPGTGRGRWALRASAVSCVGLAISYGWQPDWLAAVTLLPAWCWLVPGLVLAGWGFCRQRKRLGGVVFVSWLAYAGFWHDHYANRIEHRAQIEEVADELSTSVGPSSPLIVGGDFNVPPNDAALAALRPRLVDTFRQAGCGWGGTGIAACPLFRVDQIWAGGGLRAQRVVARHTLHSDHRLVVCDLLLE